MADQKSDRKAGGWKRLRLAPITQQSGKWQGKERIAGGRVISPFLTGCIRRIYAAIFSFMADVMPPMPMLGRSLL